MVDKERRFFRHFWTYVAVSAILMTINTLMTPPQIPWYLIVMVVWGIIIVVHAIFAFYRRS